MGAQQVRVVGERRLDAHESGELLRRERREDRLEPLDPLGVAGRGEVAEAVGVGEKRGGHGPSLGAGRRGFKG